MSFQFDYLPPSAVDYLGEDNDQPNYQPHYVDQYYPDDDEQFVDYDFGDDDGGRGFSASVRY